MSGDYVCGVCKREWAHILHECRVYLKSGHKQCLGIYRHHRANQGLGQQWSHDNRCKGADCGHRDTQRHVSIGKEGDYITGSAARAASH